MIHVENSLAQCSLLDVNEIHIDEGFSDREILDYNPMQRHLLTVVRSPDTNEQQMQVYGLNSSMELDRVFTWKAPPGISITKAAELANGEGAFVHLFLLRINVTELAHGSSDVDLEAYDQPADSVLLFLNYKEGTSRLFMSHVSDFSLSRMRNRLFVEHSDNSSQWVTELTSYSIVDLPITGNKLAWPLLDQQDAGTFFSETWINPWGRDGNTIYLISSERSEQGTYNNSVIEFNLWPNGQVHRNATRTLVAEYSISPSVPYPMWTTIIGTVLDDNHLLLADSPGLSPRALAVLNLQEKQIHMIIDYRDVDSTRKFEFDTENIRISPSGKHVALPIGYAEGKKDVRGKTEYRYLSVYDLRAPETSNMPRMLFTATTKVEGDKTIGWEPSVVWIDECTLAISVHNGIKFLQVPDCHNNQEAQEASKIQ